MTTRLFGDEDENSYLWASHDMVALMIAIPILFVAGMTSESRKSPRMFNETVLDLHSLKIQGKEKPIRPVRKRERSWNFSDHNPTITEDLRIYRFRSAIN